MRFSPVAGTGWECLAQSLSDECAGVDTKQTRKKRNDFSAGHEQPLYVLLAGFPPAMSTKPEDGEAWMLSQRRSYKITACSASMKPHFIIYVR